MKRKLQGIVLLLFHILGIFKLMRFLNRRKVIILFLHGVMDKEDDQKWEPLRQQVSCKVLGKAVERLKKYYHFVDIQEAVGMLKGEVPCKPNSIVMTFDDGYRNNVTRALPVLKARGVKPIIYLVTNVIEHRRAFWFDRMDYILQNMDSGRKNITIKGRTFVLDRSSRSNMKRSYKKMRDEIKVLFEDDSEMNQEINHIANELERASGKKIADIIEKDDWASVLTWEEIIREKDGDVDFGSHTADHLRLGLVDSGMVREQLMQSKAAIEEKLTRKCRHFCYPDGSYNAEVAKEVEKCGYESAVTTEYGLNSMGDNVFTLKRIHLSVPDKNSLEILYLLSGLSEIVNKVRNMLMGRKRGSPKTIDTCCMATREEIGGGQKRRDGTSCKA